MEKTPTLKEIIKQKGDNLFGLSKCYKIYISCIKFAIYCVIQFVISKGKTIP